MPKGKKKKKVFDIIIVSFDILFIFLLAYWKEISALTYVVSSVI